MIKGLPIVAPLSVPDASSYHGTHYSVLGIGGHREVLDIAERDAIPVDALVGQLNSDGVSSGRRKIGMTVYVISEDTTYILRDNAWPLYVTDLQKYNSLASNGNWAPFSATLVGDYVPISGTNVGTPIYGDLQLDTTLGDRWIFTNQYEGVGIRFSNGPLLAEETVGFSKKADQTEIFMGIRNENFLAIRNHDPLDISFSSSHSSFYAGDFSGSYSSIGGVYSSVIAGKISNADVNSIYVSQILAETNSSNFTNIEHTIIQGLFDTTNAQNVQASGIFGYTDNAGLSNVDNVYVKGTWSGGDIDQSGGIYLDGYLYGIDISNSESVFARGYLDGDQLNGLTGVFLDYTYSNIIDYAETSHISNVGNSTLENITNSSLYNIKYAEVLNVDNSFIFGNDTAGIGIDGVYTSFLFGHATNPSNTIDGLYDVILMGVFDTNTFENQQESSFIGRYYNYNSNGSASHSYFYGQFYTLSLVGANNGMYGFGRGNNITVYSNPQTFIGVNGNITVGGSAFENVFIACDEQAVDGTAWTLSYATVTPRLALLGKTNPTSDYVTIEVDSITQKRTLYVPDEDGIIATQDYVDTAVATASDNKFKKAFLTMGA